MSVTELDQLVKMLKTTNGRDKLFKLAAGNCKIIAHQQSQPGGNDVAVQRANSVAKSIGDCRSLMRMLKWLERYQDIGNEAGKLREKRQPADLYKSVIKLLRLLGDFGYIFGDNLQFLARFNLLPGVDQKAAAQQSKLFQFWGFVCSLILGALDLMGELRKNGGRWTAKAREGLLKVVRDVADLLVSLPNVQYVPSYKPTGRFLGACTCVSAAIATRQNWIDAAK
eukprot:TRINITY_DN823_c0_g1_i1.p1 TRINITY_DN823_c0_g1~~TRINITY_DN823_c0_g1_i1.p1  ORF type:complete len:253 (+),score=96.56 TRINITY_DN823_c0_g1_i1:85-759(+)